MNTNHTLFSANYIVKGKSTKAMKGPYLVIAHAAILRTAL